MMSEGLLICSDASTAQFIKDRLCGTVHLQIDDTAAKGRVTLCANEFDLVMINTPLTDEIGHDLALFAAKSGDCAVILLTPADWESDIAPKVEPQGVLVLTRPTSTKVFAAAVKMALAFRRRLLGLKTQNTRLRREIHEMKLVSRAKLVLVSYLSMSEEQAHEYIVKQAMDLQITKEEAAARVLKTYDTLL